MQLHQLKAKTARKTEVRIGRGGKRGKTSGRGGKGQTARAGNRPRPEMRDIIKRLPKLRGHGKNRARTVNATKVRPSVVNLSALETAFPKGGEITPQVLVKKGVVSASLGRTPTVKILGTGEVSQKFSISGCEMSASAKEKVLKAGGAVA